MFNEMSDSLYASIMGVLTEGFEDQNPSEEVSTPESESTSVPHEQEIQNTLFGANDYLPFKGGEQALDESVESLSDTRLVFKADPGAKTAAAGIVVPRHMWESKPEVGHVGMAERNEARAAVYGAEHRAPLSRSAITRKHTEVLADHFTKSKPEQIKAETAALGRLRDAKHLSRDANTLDEGEKTDTVKHEYDEQGRSFRASSAKGVAGHALYTSGAGSDAKHHVINTCPSQTVGCGGGVDANGIADTSKGTCFAPKAEAQYPGAAARRACHEQMKHDPAMTADWVLAHTNSLRNAAGAADKKNERFLFRPNVVDETDTTSRIVINHLNRQRSGEGKPPIIGNSYGKTDELHDPANNWHVTYSNTGPKAKSGGEIPENIARDKGRIRNTILAVESNGKHKTNEQGQNTPNKGSYLVTNMKRYGELDKAFQGSVTHAKYWSAGRDVSELSKDEQAEPAEAHYDGNGAATSKENAHYGHTTQVGSDGVERRYDYQKQHVLHPRLVKVGDHMVPTDSRFQDTNFLPEKKFKSKNGKDAGHLLIVTPTESTSNDQHHSTFTHHVDQSTIEHAKSNNGEYVIDSPEEQEKARGKAYIPPVAIKITKRKQVS